MVCGGKEQVPAANAGPVLIKAGAQGLGEIGHELGHSRLAIGDHPQVVVAIADRADERIAHMSGARFVHSGDQPPLGAPQKRAEIGEAVVGAHVEDRPHGLVDFLQAQVIRWDVVSMAHGFFVARSKHRFEEIFEEEGIEQLVFEVEDEIVAYAECSYEVTGSDNWINPRYFEKRDMRPLFVDELAVHPEMHGRGVGSFVLEQLHHLARVHGLNALVLEVAENNERALNWYKKRTFKKLDAAIFMAAPVENEPELLPPRELPPAREPPPPPPDDSDDSGGDNA